MMEAKDLPNELDRKHAQREERRQRAQTYERHEGWRWKWGWREQQGIERYDRLAEQEFQDGKQRDD